MSRHRSLLTHSILRFSIALTVLFALSSLHAQNATAPTASQDPAVIDQIWQKASSKYDSQRATLLQERDALQIA